MTSLAEVWLWGTRIGAIALEPGSRVTSFEYDPAFLPSGIQLSPLHLPLVAGVHAFPGLAAGECSGLPGLLADALPGKFGATLVDAWLIAQGREPSSFDVVQRLLLVGECGTGALGFRPASGTVEACESLDVAALARLVDRVQRFGLRTTDGLVDGDEHSTFQQLYSVASRTQGDGPAALVDCSAQTGEVRASQDVLPAGFESCILEFDFLEPCEDGVDARAIGLRSDMPTRCSRARPASTLRRRESSGTRGGATYSGAASTVGQGASFTCTAWAPWITSTPAQSRVSSSSLRSLSGSDWARKRQRNVRARRVPAARARPRRAPRRLRVHDGSQGAMEPRAGPRFCLQLCAGVGSACGAHGPRGQAQRLRHGGPRPPGRERFSGRAGQALRIARRVRGALERWPEIAQEAGLGPAWTERVQRELLLDLVPAGERS